MLVTDRLLVDETDRNVFTSTDYSVANRIEWVTNFSATEMSGTNLRELGIYTESGADAGSAWNREGFSSVTFDGTNELGLSVVYRIGSL